MKFSSSGSAGNHSFSDNNAHQSSPVSSNGGMRSTQQRPTSSGPRSAHQRTTTQSTQRTEQQQTNNDTLSNVGKAVGAGLLGFGLGKMTNSNRSQRNYSRSYNDDDYAYRRSYTTASSNKHPILTVAKAMLSLIIIAAIVWGGCKVVGLFTKSEQKQQPVQQTSQTTTVWGPMTYNTSGKTEGGYYLCNNTILEAYTTDFKNDSTKKSLKIKALHTTTAETAVDMRNAHFYDVIDLVKNQKANPSNNIYEIEYIGVGENENGGDNVEVIYFVLDENLILDILDGYITYTNLYEYCLDLQLHEALK